MEDYRASRRPLLRHLIEPQEGHYISLMDSRAKGRQHKKELVKAMNSPSDQASGGWLENRGFGALDWASQKHSVVVVDPKGKVLEDFEIDHSALGWTKFRERIKAYGSIPFAIETSQGKTHFTFSVVTIQTQARSPCPGTPFRGKKNSL